MVIFKELRITSDGNNLFIDASIAPYDYFQNMYIKSVSIDTENSVILVKGNVPGPKKSLVMIRTAVKKPTVKKEAANLVNYAEKTTEVAEETTTEETTEE